jgi:hypothetical protein
MHLTDFLDAHNIPWTSEGSHGRFGWTQVHCPRCGSQNWHCGIKDDLSRANCYICGSHSVPGLLKTISGSSWKSVYDLLGKRDFVVRETQEHSGRYTPPTNLIPIEESYDARNYVQERGFDPDYLEAVWGCQATNGFSNYPFRLFIPVIRNKRPVSWTARATRGQEPRYQTARADEKSFDEKKWLLGLDMVRKSAVVCEGPTDAMRVGPGAVATFGLAVTPEQVLLISRIPERVICFDNSERAQKTADKLCETLSVFPGKTVRCCLDSPDPGSASRGEIRQLRDMVFGKGK